jgi:hypothetical protein
MEALIAGLSARSTAGGWLLCALGLAGVLEHGQFLRRGAGPDHCGRNG